MRKRHRLQGMIVLTPLLLAACGTAKASDPSAAITGSAPAAKSAMPSMDMQDMGGMSMPGMMASASAGQGTPSATSTMVCSSEIRRDVATLLAMPALPRVMSSWVDHRYTCMYHLPVGTMLVSVQESASKSAALAYLSRTRELHPDGRTLTGAASFGLPAFQTGEGLVGFAKDDKTLLVDPTGLPDAVGHSSRSEFAYTVASDILGCWSGD